MSGSIETRRDVSSVEWLFPIKGRWLRYLLLAAVIFLFVVVVYYWVETRDILPTLAWAERGYFRCSLGRGWGFGAGGSASMAMHQGYHVSIGPWRVWWLAAEWGDSRALENARVLVDCVGTIASTALLWLAFRLARAHKTPGSSASNEDSYHYNP